MNIFPKCNISDQCLISLTMLDMAYKLDVFRAGLKNNISIYNFRHIHT